MQYNKRDLAENELMPVAELERILNFRDVPSQSASQRRLGSLGSSPTRMSDTPRLHENDVGSSMKALTTGGDTAASPMPTEPSSAVMRTSATSCV